MAVIESPGQLLKLLDTPRPMLLGGGSNTLFLADFPGRVLLNRIRGIQAADAGEHTVRVTAGAGENWHDLVRWSIRAGLHGLENLALIPGCVGAAPMQNIGAYGVQLSDCLESVEVWDRTESRLRWLDKEECGLGYRTSRFRDDQQTRFVITRVRLLLDRSFRPRTDYETLAAELRRMKIDHPEPAQVAAAVMRVRRHRLPDPGRIANAGSFFKNPVVEQATADKLQARHDDLPCWPDSPGRVKLSAGWMIEKLGWKGRRLGDAGVYANHALVLINHGQADAESVVELAEQIYRSVFENFGIRLEPEPRLVGLPGDSPLCRPGQASQATNTD